MTLYFIFKSIKSDSKQGLIVQSLPPIVRAELKTSILEINGYDGDIVTELGYKAYDRTVTIALDSTANTDDILSWLTGKGDLVLSNEPDKVYKAQVIKQIEVTQKGHFKFFKVVFHVQPFKFSMYDSLKSVSSAQITAKKISINNKGTLTAKPLIYIEGSGTVEFKVNNKWIFKYTFKPGETRVYIDSLKEDAYSEDGVLKNRNMVGDFIILEPGQSDITWSGTLTEVKINIRSRWI